MTKKNKVNQDNDFNGHVAKTEMQNTLNKIYMYSLKPHFMTN